MDGDSGAITDTDPVVETAVPAPFQEEHIDRIPTSQSDGESNSSTVMDLVVGLRVAAQELYASEDIEVRMCLWLICSLVVLCVCIILAWKTYGQEIMTVLACQDKLSRSGSMSRESSRQSSSEESSVIAGAPSSVKKEPWLNPGRPVDSSNSEPHHPKKD